MVEPIKIHFDVDTNLISECELIKYFVQWLTSANSYVISMKEDVIHDLNEIALS